MARFFIYQQPENAKQDDDDQHHQSDNQALNRRKSQETVIIRLIADFQRFLRSQLFVIYLVGILA